MAEIDWSALRTPDYATNALKATTLGREDGLALAKQNALRQYATDPEGAISQVAAVDPTTAAQLQSLHTSQTKIRAGQDAAGKLAKGDYAGAVEAYAPTGDIQGVSALQGQIIDHETRKMDVVSKQATRLLNIYGQAGGDQNPAAKEQLSAAFDATAPYYQAVGSTPQQIEQLKSQILTNPRAALSALANPPKITFHTAGDTLFAVNDDTGQKIGAWTGGKFITLNNPDGGQSVAQVGGDGGGSGPAPGPAGAPATQAPAATQAPSAPAAQIQGPVGDQITATAQHSGATPDEIAYLHRTAQLESGGQPTAQNGKSTGLFQFHPDTFAAVGGKDINDVGQQTQAALTLARQDKAALSQALGRDPTPAELYIAHQQGAPGAIALLKADPNAPAASVLTAIYRNPDVAAKAINRNGGSANMTAGQFVDMWRSKYGDRQGQAGVAAPDAGPQGQQGATPGVRILYNTSGNGESDLTDDSVQLLAARYLRDGTIPPLGMKSTADRRRILNAATKMAGDLGLNAGDLIAGTADTKAAGKALTQNAADMQRISGFEKTAEANADLALSLAPKGGSTTQVPVINRWIQAGRKAIKGDVDVANFDVALGTFADEYAKVVAGSNGSTDSVRSEAYRRINGAMTQQQLAGVIATMKREMANRMAGMQAVDEGIRARLRGGIPAAPGADAGGAAPGAAPPASHVIHYDAQGNRV